MSDLVTAVIRLASLDLPKAEAEKLLGRPLNRFNPEKAYGQIDLPESDWVSLVEYIAAVGPGLQALRKSQPRLSVSLDIACFFRDNMMATSTVIPSRVAQIVGQFAIDIVLTVYRTEAN